MAERRERKRAHVQDLRGLARALGAQQSADNASNDRAMQMVDEIRAKRLKQAERRRLDSAVAGFLSTYPQPLRRLRWRISSISKRNEAISLILRWPGARFFDNTRRFLRF